MLTRTAGFAGSLLLAMLSTGLYSDSVATAGQNTTSTVNYAVKPSDVSVPSDVPVGQYYRIIRPFPNWTLICDQNLAKKQKVCNITQAIIDSEGATVFSWSLVATQDGQPFFILRLPLPIGKGAIIQIDIRDGGTIISFPIKGCDANACIAYQQVGPRLRTAVSKGLTLKISYVSDALPEAISFKTPLEGLAAALATI